MVVGSFKLTLANLAALIVAAFAFTSCSYNPHLNPAPTAVALHEIEVRSSLQQYAAARERGDGAAAAASYTEDADFWNTRSDDGFSSGPAVRQSFLSDKPQPFRLEPLNISFPSPTVAWVDAYFFGANPKPNGIAFYVMVKRGDRWLIRSARITDFAPFRTAFTQTG